MDTKNHLLPKEKHQIPRFYGLPNIHKPPNSNSIPPVRPIISHSNSLLTPSVKFLDHILQPLARSYSDYLHNSTSLIKTLATFKVPHNSLLVSLDIVNLFPSIPQNDCLQIIYQEMITLAHLLIFDPNFIIQLLTIHINNNFFEFLNIPFQQIVGSAMGTAFSPTIANIYISVLLERFLTTIDTKPLLLARYIY